MLRTGRPWFDIPQWIEEISVLHGIQTVFEAHPASYAVETAAGIPPEKKGGVLKLTIKFLLLLR
jgi:hypothetical protein